MTKEITDGEVTRVAMRIAMTAFSQLQMESEHLDDVDILKQYILMCPFVSAESPSIQAALNALQNNSNVGMEAKPQDVHSSRQVTAKDSENCSTKSVIVPNAVRKPVQRHSVVNIILILFRTIILDTPLAMVFAIYLGLVWTHRLNDLYFQKQFENLEWTKERAYHETTYYKRYCDSQDLTTRHPADLFLPEDATPDEAYAHQLKHGMTVFPNVLSEQTATNLRDYIVSRNRNLTDDEAIYVINNQNRYSFGLGTEEPSLVSAVKELARHARLKPALEKILGPNPALIEMTAITAAYGAVDQYWHDDVVSRASALQFGRAFGPSYSIFIQLQNTTKEMGATSACPGSQMCADGTMDTYCDSDGFQVVNEDEYWRLGDAMLMNMNTWHRGAGHTDPNAPDRVMMIMTFVPKPRTRAESRQLSQGITFSLRWDMWGHTLGDLANADTAMTQPWATLRALGLYKPKNADWGIDFVTGSTHRIANGDHGYRDDQLEELIEKGGFKEIPKFLHGNISGDEGWHEYYLYTLINCENFAKSVHRGIIAGYIIIQVIVMIFSLILSDNKRTSFGRFFWAMIRVFISHALVYGLYKAANNHVDNTQWAKDLNAGRLYTSPFGVEDSDYGGPTTFPHRTDILLDTRYNSDYLAMYRDYINIGHPGNLVWKDVLDAVIPIYKGYSDDLFRNAVAEFAVSTMLAESRRFLYQSPDSHWVWISAKDSVKHATLQLKINSNPVIKAIVSKIDHLISESKYGYLRETAMAQVETKPFLEEMKKKILGESLELKYTKSIVRFGDSGMIGAATPFPSLFTLERPVSSAKHVRRPVALHPGDLPEEPGAGAWIKSGDIVEAYYKESRKVAHWYMGTVTKIASQGLFSISFQDGTFDTMGVGDVRRHRPVEIGEELQFLLGQEYRNARVESTNDDETYNLYVHDTGRIFNHVHQSLFRRED